MRPDGSPNRLRGAFSVSSSFCAVNLDRMVAWSVF
jgi:hypothetical protein